MTEVTVVEGDAPAEEAAPQVVAEVVSDAAVEIARIEADRDIDLALIAGDLEKTAAETLAENINENLQRELIECRNTISTQAAELTTLKQTLSSTQASLEALALPSPRPSADILNDGTQVLPLDSETPSEPVELEPVAVLPEVAPEPPKKRRPVRWI